MNFKGKQIWRLKSGIGDPKASRRLGPPFEKHLETISIFKVETFQRFQIEKAEAKK